MQDYVEMPTVDLTTLDYCSLIEFIYIISEVLMKDSSLIVKIIKKDNDSVNILQNEK